MRLPRSSPPLTVPSMHILFVHQKFPAQFGHIARYLIREHGFQCTFVNERLPPEDVAGIRRLQYKPQGGATKENHYCTRGFENAVAHTHGVYEICKANAWLKPDLIVGHSGFGSTLFLNELYPNTPIINYFEYYYRPRDSDMDFRPEFPTAEIDMLRSRCRNAMILLDLQNCRLGYCPTRWQRSTLPNEYAGKLRVIFDGIDPEIWQRRSGFARQAAGQAIPTDVRVVTYVSRGFESMRGFDIFMKVAKRIYTAMPNVFFIVVGTDRVAYGGDLKYIKEKSFKEHVLNQDDYDMSKFLFTGNVPPSQLSEILSMGNLHIYLTVPFVLSWSLFNSLACGAVVLGSNTGPVRELIRHEETGLLADFYDLDGLAEQALRVLRDPPSFRHLGEAGMRLIQENYTLEHTLPQMLQLYRDALEPSAEPSTASGQA